MGRAAAGGWGCIGQGGELGAERPSATNANSQPKIFGDLMLASVLLKAVVVLKLSQLEFNPSF